jgi:CysZ protein
MIRALIRAFAQFSDPATRGFFWRAVAVSTLVFVTLWVLAWFGLTWAAEALGTLVEEGFWSDVLAWAFGAAAFAALLVTSFLLFPAVVGVALSFFLDAIVEAVERRHYPGLPAPRQQPLWEQVWRALGFGALAIALNLLALPFYLLLLFVPPFNLLLFYGLNGYLFGREYFDVVAVRRLDPAALRSLRQGRRGRLLLAGAMIAFLLTLPIINLAMPIVAASFMVHVFQDLSRSRAGTPA